MVITLLYMLGWPPRLEHFSSNIEFNHRGSMTSPSLSIYQGNGQWVGFKLVKYAWSCAKLQAYPVCVNRFSWSSCRGKAPLPGYLSSFHTYAAAKYLPDKQQKSCWKSDPFRAVCVWSLKLKCCWWYFHWLQHIWGTWYRDGHRVSHRSLIPARIRHRLIYKPR